jgi:hypothetical protein
MKLTRKGQANGSHSMRWPFRLAEILLLLPALEMPTSRQFLGVRSHGAVGWRCSNSEKFKH